MSEINIRPLHDRIVVRTIKSDEMSAGGIFIPENAAEKPSQGTVLAVGKGKTLSNGKIQPVAVEIGDRIMFGQYVGQEVEVDNETFMILNEEEVIGVLI